MPPRKHRPRKPPPPTDPPPRPAEPAGPPPGRHAAGIDAGDRTHWACVGHTPDGAATTREFPAHTPGLRRLVAWLKHCGVTTVALEATGAYAHVLFLTLLEAGLAAYSATVTPVILRAGCLAQSGGSIRVSRNFATRKPSAAERLRSAARPALRACPL